MAIVLFWPVLIHANTDVEKRIELEKRVELLENEVKTIRQSIDMKGNSMESSYMSGVLEKIRENWFYPEDLDVRLDDFIQVSLIINKDGTIADQKIAESSGNEPFNGFALECISNSAPLPPIPDEINRETMELELRFRPPQN